MLNKVAKVIGGSVLFGLAYAGMMAACYVIANGFTE